MLRAVTLNPITDLKADTITMLPARHLLQQMRSLTGDIEQLMLRSFREEFRELAQAMNWEAANGDTAANTGVLNGRLIPFLSDYVSRTHDYGAVRDATMLLIFNAVRYQNGEASRLMQLFDRLMDDRSFAGLFQGEEQASLEHLLQTGADAAAAQKPVMAEFADNLANLLLRGANGQAGLEHVQQFYTIMNGMLMNESVYMPVMHVMLPVILDGVPMFSEMWVDPDGKKDKEEGGRAVKLFLKFDIQGLGKFELLMTLQDRESRMQLLVPKQLVKEDKKIQAEVAGILKKNGIRYSQLMVRERVRDRRVDEVFRRYGKERTINVRI